MKKFRTVLLVSVCVVLMIFLTGCVNKAALTYDEFKTKMGDKNFTVKDATSQMSEYDYVEKVYLAINEDSTYQIEFYKLSDSDNAASFYSHNKNIFEDSKQSGSKETTVSVNNHSKYTLETGGKYKVISRIDDTVIYLNVDEEYKSVIKDILDDLGY